MQLLLPLAVASEAVELGSEDAQLLCLGDDGHLLKSEWSHVLIANVVHEEELDVVIKLLRG